MLVVPGSQDPHPDLRLLQVKFPQDSQQVSHCEAPGIFLPPDLEYFGQLLGVGEGGQPVIFSADLRNVRLQIECCCHRQPVMADLTGELIRGDQIWKWSDLGQTRRQIKQERN